MARGKKVLKLRAQAKKFTFKYEGAGLPEGAVGKYYPAEDVVPKKGPTPVRNPPKLRASITPGTVLILLAGRFKGKRVVFLKQLTSGLLLVTGPYSANGVPLRRVNQRYVIATSTKVSVDGVNVSDVDDAFFARDKKTDGTGASAERKSKQEKVDTPLLANIAKVDMLGAYIKSKFTLRNGDKPYQMKF